MRKTITQVSNTNNELKRTMKSRHLFMIALGGVIGTGLFNGSGFIISQAGPGGSVLAFIRWIINVFRYAMSW